MNHPSPYESVLADLRNALRDAQLHESYVPVEEIARQIVAHHPNASRIAYWINELISSPSDA